MKSTSRHLKSIATILGSIALTLLIIGLSQARFLEQDGGASVTVGLFSSCALVSGDYRCKSSDVWWWSSSFGRGVNRITIQEQWKAYQAFLMMQVILYGITLYIMRLRPRWAKRAPARNQRLKVIFPMMQLAVIVFGAIALALVCTARYRLEGAFGNWRHGTSLKLQIAAYVLSFVAYALYDIGWCCEPKPKMTFDPVVASPSSIPGLQVQHVAININGQTVMATLSPLQPVPAQVPHVAYPATPVYIQQPVPAQIVQHGSSSYAPVHQAQAPAYPQVHPTPITSPYQGETTTDVYRMG